MRIIVLGAGITGVTTAYFLGRAGHEVTVLDGADAAAAGASSANAGFMAPNDSFAWAAPEAPVQMLKAAVGHDTGLSLRLSLDPALYRWGIRFLGECRSGRSVVNSITQLRIAAYSQEVQRAIEAEVDLAYSQQRKGNFYLFRGQGELERAFARREMFKSYGMSQRLLSISEVIDMEPALNRLRSAFAGAIFGVTDGSGECEQFTKQLASYCIRAFGAVFDYRQHVVGLTLDGARVEGVRVNGSTRSADAYVLCLGVGSARVARTAGLRLPIYPVRGFAATIPILDPNAVPTRPGLDQTRLVAWSSMGDRLRLCSSAQVVGYRTSWRDSDRDRILRIGREMFGDALDYDRTHFRAALRPMTPGGPPLVGRTQLSNLYLNTGHGHLGWTMGAGTGRAIADLIDGKEYNEYCITQMA